MEALCESSTNCNNGWGLILVEFVIISKKIRTYKKKRLTFWMQGSLSGDLK